MKLLPLVAIVLVAAGPPIGAGNGAAGAQRRGLADLLDRPDGPRIAVPPPPTFDDAKVRAAGIRKLVGKHITLYTDSEGAEVDSLPALFDAAVPQWAKYFDVDAQRIADWRMQGYLMRDRDPFRAVGMLPPESEGLVHGYSIDHEMWLVEQPTAYYRRHLLLHEGTHGFMNTLLGGCGPGWYMEGVAELLGTHRWDGKQLTLGIVPPSREDVPGLGRIRLVQDAFVADRGLPIPAVLATDNTRRLQNEAYAWCWALAKLLDAHPRYQKRFRQLHKQVLAPDFTDRFRRAFADDWPALTEEWRLFVGTLDHNHDVARTAIDFVEGEPLTPGSARETTIAADRGWQSSGMRLDAGKTYRITAHGRYQVGSHPRPWPCEPNGVTIEYYRGRPLGMVVGTVFAGTGDGATGNRPHAQGDKSMGSFLEPISIGLETTISPDHPGTLYLKINESPGRLADNAGEVRIRVECNLR